MLGLKILGILQCSCKSNDILVLILDFERDMVVRCRNAWTDQFADTEPYIDDNNSIQMIQRENI